MNPCNCRYLSLLAAAAFVASSQLVAQTASAPAYPVKPVRIVVPYPSGAGADLHARMLAPKLSERFGQTVIVDNRGGANGTIAMELVARSAPDGYTVVYALPAQYAVNPALYPKISYDSLRDFDPIMLVVRAPLILFTHPSLPVQSIGALIKLARAQPESLVLGSAGNGSAGHLCLEMFRNLSGSRILHVPYKGAAPSMVDLISGQVQLSFLAWSTAGGYARSGRLRALGVTSEKRATTLRDLPAIAETLPGFDIVNWYGLAGPRGMPRSVIAKLNAETTRALQDADLRLAFEKEAIELIAGSAEAFGDYLKSEIVKWGNLVRGSGLRID